MRPPDTIPDINHAERSAKACQSVVHQFSRSFARLHGIKEAIIGGYLANRIASTEKREGEGYRCTLDDLHEHYPYMSRTAIAKALRKLIADNVLTVHHNNFKPWDHTAHYAFASREHRQSTQTDPIYFQVADAMLHDLPCALLLMNLRMRIGDEHKRERLKEVYRVCARGLADLLPLTRSTISRAFRRLERDGVIKLRRCQGFDRAYLVETRPLLADGAKPDSSGAIQDPCGSSANPHDASGNSHASNPHITNTLKADIESGHSKSGFASLNSYEGRPAAPDADRVCLPAHAGPESSNFGSHAAGDTAESGSLVKNGGEGSLKDGEASSVMSDIQRDPQELVVDRMRFRVSPEPDTLVPRIPLPASLKELRQSNGVFCRRTESDQVSILNGVSAKVRAVIQAHGVDRVFRWLAVKDDEELYRLIREAVERYQCRRADFVECDEQLGVDRFCVDWWVEACRQYLDDNLHSAGDPWTNIVVNTLQYFLPPYFSTHQAELKREGLDHLRYGEEVRIERCASPDAGLEKDEDISAAEKTRVFYNALLSINRGGRWNSRGGRVHDVVTFSQSALKQVRNFFQINPNWTAHHLLDVLQCCIMRVYYSEDPGGYLKDFAVTQGTNISYFMRYLERIIRELQYESFVPKVTFPKHWAKKEAV